MRSIEYLERPAYGFNQVDRLLHLTSGTARRWIEGYGRGHRHYEPVIRAQTTGSETVTWGEFVEAKLLSGFRNAGASIIRLRPAVERLRAEFGPYPLAMAKPFLDESGHDLLFAVQEEVGLESALRLVVRARDSQPRLELTPPAREFIDEAQIEDGHVAAFRILDDVVIDPRIAFGEPSIRAVRTDILAELFGAGESVEMIATKL